MSFHKQIKQAIRWEPVRSGWGFSGQVINDQPCPGGYRYFA